MLCLSFTPVEIDFALSYDLTYLLLFIWLSSTFFLRTCRKTLENKGGRGHWGGELGEVSISHVFL